MKLLQTETLEAAREKLLSFMKSRQDSESISLLNAESRILSEDVFSTCDIPHFRRSTVDGYAVKSRDTQGSSESIPVFLTKIEDVSMGTPARSILRSGECAYVPTGGMIPEGADAVVMLEFCEPFEENSIAVYDSVSNGRNVVIIGEDVKTGSLIFKKGTKIRPSEIGALASAGFLNIPVFKKLTLTIISTGDELVPPDSIPGAAQVRDINTYAIQALAEKRGFEVSSAFVLKDDEDLLKNAILQAMKKSDIVAVSGGSSQGNKDLTAKIMDELSSPGVFVHGISLKPGKPTILGYDEKSGTALIGLPGHPVAALMVFELIAVWVKNRLTNQADEKFVYARMNLNVASAPGKTTCQTVRLTEGEAGYIAEPVYGKSGVMSTLTMADGYTLIDMNKEGLRKDELVKVRLF